MLIKLRFKLLSDKVLSLEFECDPIRSAESAASIAVRIANGALECLRRAGQHVDPYLEDAAGHEARKLVDTHERGVLSRGLDIEMVLSATQQTAAATSSTDFLVGNRQVPTSGTTQSGAQSTATSSPTAGRSQFVADDEYGPMGDPNA